MRYLNCFQRQDGYYRPQQQHGYYHHPQGAPVNKPNENSGILSSISSGFNNLVNNIFGWSTKNFNSVLFYLFIVRYHNKQVQQFQ